jgi:N-acyl-D-aspartate/D-glutamate deacylase
MIDLRLSGGTVVDGTGAPATRADVGIDGGRIVAVGRFDEAARRTVDVSGATVVPGFVDVHTHYDAQLFWDPALTPSCFHGVTTVFAGNCGFTLAPWSERDAEFLLRLLARVEGIPTTTLERGVPWGSWRSVGEYLAAVEGRVALNTGFIVGHSALRRAVLGEDATGRVATPAEVDRMAALLADGIAAGGLGLSSSGAPTHNDDEGRPVPSRVASRDELLALATVVGGHPGTTLEMVPGQGAFDDNIELLAAMSAAAGRPLNWNVLQVNTADADLVEHRLAASSAAAAAAGGRLVPLTLPDALRTRISFATGFLLDTLPGWREPMALPVDARLAVLADPVARRRLAEQAATAPRTFVLRGINDWAGMRIGETGQEAVRGQRVGDLAAATGRDPFDVLCEVVVADGLRTGLYPPDRGDDDASWALRAEVWRRHDVVVGASDAGAHLDMITTWSYPTTLLREAVRRRGLLTLEEAVRLLTDAPARLYGLRDRGRIAPGFHADIVVLDPETVGPRPTEWRDDLPGGAGRLYAEADGIELVLVNGVAVVAGEGLTGARPGAVVRSGVDTDTVGVG